MIPKIIRIALVALVILVLAMKLPPLYKTTFEQKERTLEYSFSEVLNEFVQTLWDYDTTQMRNVQVGIDMRGKHYKKDELMQIFPIKYARQLMHDGTFPDSIRNTHVTLEMIQESSAFPLFLGVGGGPRSLLWLFESNTDRIRMDIPNDMFRLTETGLEFIETGRNHVKGVNREKSDLFTQSLVNIGLTFPLKNIFGSQSAQKMKEEGYFMIDQKNEFFHMKMVDGQPVCKQVPLPDQIEVIYMNTLDDEKYYGYVYDQNYNIYLLGIGDYFFHQLDIPDYSDYRSTIVMQKSLFFNTYSLYGNVNVKHYVLDKETNQQIASKVVDYPDYTKSKVGQLENYLFPFKIRTTQGGERQIRSDWYDPSCFIWLNLILAFIFVAIKGFKKYFFKDLFSYLDVLIVITTGIYGFIAVLLFPKRS